MMKNLHHIARSGFSLLVAFAIALPGVGFSAAANQAWAAAQQRAVNDPVPTTLEEAKANLDLANALESEAAEEEAKAKAALDAAKAAHDTASTNHQAAISVVDQATSNANAKIDEIESNAQAEYDAAYARVAEAVKENQAAQQAKNEAQANLSQAKADYDAAQQAYDSLANSGNAELQQASEKLREAEEAYDSAVTQYKEAFNAYKVANDERNEATAALNEAKKKVAACEAAVAAAQSKVDAAQKALDEAKGNLGTASEDTQKEALEAAVAAAQSKLSAAQSEKADAQSRLSNAKSEQSIAQQAANEAQAALDAAKKNTGGVDIDVLENAVKTAQEEYDAAKKAYDEGAQNAGANKSFQQALADKTAAENAFEEAKARATEALQKYDAAKKELAAISAGGGGNQQTVLSVKDFFVEQDSTAASDLFNTMGDASFTQSGSPGDATDVEFVFRALDLIENLNSIRSSIGLPDLRVTDELMAYEVISLNFASTVQFSYNLSSPRELFAYSGGDSNWAMSGLQSLYDQQKQVWENALSTNTYWDSSSGDTALPEGWSNMTPEELVNACSGFFSQVYVYANVIAPTNMYVGAAANHRPDADYGFAFGFRPAVTGEALTVGEWKARLSIWIDQKQASTASITPANITTAATDEEIAAAQAKVDACETDYNNAVADRDTKEDLLNAAQTQLSAAESVKSLEEALATASTKLEGAQQALDNAQNSTGDLNDPNHPLNVAVANTQATLQAKNQAVDSIQNEITTLDTKIGQFQTELNNAQSALDAYTAADTTAEEVALAAAQRELESAKRDLEAALAEVEQLTDQVTELRATCLRLNDKQIAIRDNVMGPARQASDIAKSEFYTIAKQTQEESDYRALYGAKNQLDHKRDAYNKIIWNMPELESDAEVAQRNEVAARDRLIAASDKLDAAKLLTLEGVMANPISEYSYADFLVLNDHAQNVKDAQALVPAAANKESAAKADLDAAQAAYDAAHAKHLTSLDDAAEAKRIYESFLGQKDPSTKPGDSNNGSNGSEDDPSVEIWNPGKPSTSTAGNKNAGSKGTGSASEVGERDGQGDGSETESVDEALAEESTGSNTVNGRTITSKQKASQAGVDPVVIVGIIGCCLLIAAGILAFLLARRRRAAAEAAAGTVAVAAGASAPVAADNATAATAADAANGANAAGTAATSNASAEAAASDGSSPADQAN